MNVNSPPLTFASTKTAVNDVLPEDAIVTADAGGFRIWALHVIEMIDGMDFVDTGSWATMGTALPSAMGGEARNPDRDVVALVGDGGLLMSMQELHTAALENIPVVTVVMNNSDYATISAEAAENFTLPEGAYEWNEMPARFTTIAESMGVTSERAETPEEIRNAVTRAFDRESPTLIEVPTDPKEPQAKPLE